MRLGYVPLSDCAPLLVADELGLFEKHGIDVELCREPGWATVREKLIFGELDAAHALAGMAFAMALGAGSIACDALAALVLSSNGNAITLSRELAQSGVKDAHTLKREVDRLRSKRTLTFGIVYPASSHNYLLREWLASGGIRPDQDVRVVVVPPPQMVRLLKNGSIDGFCSGEPWNSVAVAEASAWIASTSVEIAPGHPEKVLLTTRRFAEEREADHLALIKALLEACEYCESPANRAEIASVLARPAHLNLPVEHITKALCFNMREIRPQADAAGECLVFGHGGANEPTPERAAAVLQQLKACGLISLSQITPSLARQVFRMDIFQKALRASPPKNENEIADEILNLTN